MIEEDEKAVLHNTDDRGNTLKDDANRVNLNDHHRIHAGWTALVLDGISDTVVAASVGAVAALELFLRFSGTGQASPLAFIPRAFPENAVYPAFFLCGLVAFLSGAFGGATVLARFEGIDPVKPPWQWKARTFAVWMFSALMPVTLFALWALPGPGTFSLPEVAAFLIPLYIITLFNSARGIRNVTAQPGADESRRSLVTGVMVLAALAVLFRRAAGEHPGIGDVLVFLVATQLSIVRKRRLEVAGANDQNSQKPWAAGGTVLLALTILLAGIASMGGGMLKELASLITWLTRPLIVLFDYLLIPVGYFAEVAAVFLKRFVKPEALSLMQQLAEMNRRLDPENAEETLEAIAPWVRWTLVLLGLVVFASVLWLAISKLTRAPQSQSFEERRESLNGGESLKSWGEEVLKEVKDLVAKALSGLSEFGFSRKPGNIEELYALTLRVLEKHGIRRNSWHTPFEYLAFAQTRITVPACFDALSSITWLFARCHYSMKAPDPTEWRRALEAYELILKEDPDRPDSTAPTT